MWRMLFAYVMAAHAKSSVANVVWVGADEVNRREGHNYLIVFADLMAIRVPFAKPGEHSSDWETFAMEMLRHNGRPKAIQYVATDMSAAYTKELSENHGSGRVGFMKFNVIQHVVGAYDQVLRAESLAYGGKLDRLSECGVGVSRIGQIGRIWSPKSGMRWSWNGV